MATPPIKPSRIWGAGDPGNSTDIGDAAASTGYYSEIPKSTDHNGIFNRQDSNTLHLFEEGVAVWRTDVTYPALAITKENGTLYQNVSGADSINEQPSATPAVWAEMFVTSAVTTGDTFPPAPVDDDLHILSTTMDMYHRYNDGTSVQWVNITNQGAF